MRALEQYLPPASLARVRWFLICWAHCAAGVARDTPSHSTSQRLVSLSLQSGRSLSNLVPPLLITATAGGCEHRRPPPRRYSGTFDVMRDIVASQGARGLFTGAMARVGKVAPACGIMIFSYEAGKRFFRRRNAERAEEAAAARDHKKF